MDHPVKVLQRLPDLIGIREAARGVLAHTGEALDLARIHGVDHAHDRGVLPVVELRQIVVTKAVFRRPAFGIEGPHQAGGVLAGIAHPVQGLRVRRLGRGARDVLLQRLPRSLGSLEVAGQIMRQQGVVGGPLHVGLAAQGVDAAAADADVAEQELHDGQRADVLHGHGMVALAEGIHDGPGLVRLAGGGEGLVHGQQIRLGRPRDRGNLLQIVPIIMLFHQLEDAVRVLQRIVALDQALAVLLERPRGLVIGVFLRVIAGEQAVVERELGVHEERGVRVAQYVILKIEIMIEDILDHAAEERDIRARAKRGVHA